MCLSKAVIVYVKVSLLGPVFVCLIWFLMSLSTIFQLRRDGSSCVELKLVLSVVLKDITQWCLWGSNPGPFLWRQTPYHLATAIPVSGPVLRRPTESSLTTKRINSWCLITSPLLRIQEIRQSVLFFLEVYMHVYVCGHILLFSLTAWSAKTYICIVVTAVVRVPVPFHSVLVHSRHTALKFSRSPYLDNNLSESIHTCTIDTL